MIGSVVKGHTWNTGRNIWEQISKNGGSSQAEHIQILFIGKQWTCVKGTRYMYMYASDAGCFKEWILILFLGSAKGPQQLRKVKQVTDTIKTGLQNCISTTHLIEKDKKKISECIHITIFIPEARGVMTLIHYTVPFRLQMQLKMKCKAV